MFLCDSLFMEFVVAIGQFYELYCVCVWGGDGSKGFVTDLGAPSMVRMFGLNLA